MQNNCCKVPTSGSQEGAFENVKLVCSGEQGQLIRQLIGSHVLRRVAMCCLTSAKGRRQHLAVSHEKGKVRVCSLPFASIFVVICNVHLKSLVNWMSHNY